MTLTAGTRFGAYEIVEPVGAGGMGEVYRATDTKLGREVAIKTLPKALAADANRLARFEREAKLLAALNHPNIAVIYGLEEQDDTRCIAMELIEGQTLEEKLRNGPLQPDEALGLALQVAQALEAAHEKGVVHRDLKPANIMITDKGQVKVLDFGLAKAFSEDPEQETLGHSPALSLAMTQQGLVLGTAAYMSPEQASGQATDQRADIWAFGVVLFEMLSGLPLFSGESVPHILADVLKTEPDWRRLPDNLDLRIERLLDRCLRKKPYSRYHSIADVRVEIEEILNDPEGRKTESVVSVLPSKRSVMPWVAGSVALTAAVMGYIGWAIGPRPQSAPGPLPVNRFDYDLPEGQRLRSTNRRLLAFSPDGRHFVYNTDDGLYLRPLGELVARLIPGTEEGLASPAFSPDGQSLVYGSFPGELRRISISGGAPVVIGPIDLGLGGVSWAADGTVFYSHTDEGILRVSANGGTPEVIVPPDEGTVLYGTELLPDGDSLLFSIRSQGGWDAAQIVAQSLSTNERTVLVEGGSDAHYVPTGHLIYALGDGLFAVRFDLDSLTVSGGAVPLVQGVLRAGGVGTASANYGVSADGTLVYASGSVASVQRTLVWVDRDGREEPLNLPPRGYTSPRISPDGTRVALNARDEEQDIWIWDFARETFTRLTVDPGQDRFPVWSPDGSRIAYSSQRDEAASREQFNTALDWRAANGTGVPERLSEASGQIFPHSFLPDGSGILVQGDTSGGSTNDDIGVYRFDESGAVTPLLDTTFGERFPDISRDGRWLAYASDESGIYEIYVRPFPDINADRWQVSAGGGIAPLWSRDGRELYYRNGDAMMVVSVEADQEFTVGNPELMFEGPYFGALDSGGGRSYDVSGNGERFLMIKNVENRSDAPQIIIVENWFEELKRLAPPFP